MSPTTETSGKQLESNRENAKKSTGPRSDQGKERSRLNGLRHGLTGHVLVMPWEDREAHDKFVKSIVNAWLPYGASPDFREAELANAIAEDKWRINRIRAIENNIFGEPQDYEFFPSDDRVSKPALVDTRTYSKNAKKLNLLSIYEQRIARNIKMNTAELKALQAERRAAELQALEEAKLLAQLAVVENKPTDAGREYRHKFTELRRGALSAAKNAPTGFGFSTSEINELVDRDNRLQRAIALAKSAKTDPVQLPEAA